MSTEKSHILPGHGMSKKWALPLLLASAAFAVCNAHESAFVRHSPLARRMQGNSDQAPLRRRDSPALATTMKASLKDYRRSLVENKAGKLEKLSRHIFNLQDALLNIDIIQIKAEAAEANVGPPQASPKQTAVVGTGPAGLATAIMLARRGWDNIVLYDRLPAPPRSDSGRFGDPERSYNIGMDAKGLGCLKELGAWSRVEPHCAEVVGRVDYMPGSDTPQEVNFLEKFGYAIKVIQRDCLTALLREEIEAKYADKIEMRYNNECTSIKWGARPDDPVKLQMQETRRVFPNGEVCGARPTVEAVGDPIEIVADFVVGADGAASRVRDAMEFSDTDPEEGFQVIRYPDVNERVFKTITLTVPEGGRINVDYSAVSLEDIIIDALPLQNGKMIGVVLFRPDDTRVTDAKTAEQVKELFQKYLPMFMPFIDDEGFAAFGAKREQRLPSFQYCGPVVHRRSNTVLLGDAIHTVKPFFGFGINTALDDIRWLDLCLSTHSHSRAAALCMFSECRGTEAVSIVQLSQELDQPGLNGLIAFLGPLILDSLFEKIMPGVFHPNLLIYCRKEGVTFTQARRRKQRDLRMQLSFIGAQTLWGSTAAKLYMGERLSVPMAAMLLAASDKFSAVTAALLPVHTVARTILFWSWHS